MRSVASRIQICEALAMLPLPFGHIAGIPVEETLLSFGPVVAVAGGAASVWLRERLRRPNDDTGEDNPAPPSLD
jgi:hypothetical protein